MLLEDDSARAVNAARLFSKWTAPATGSSTTVSGTDIDVSSFVQNLLPASARDWLIMICAPEGAVRVLASGPRGTPEQGSRRRAAHLAAASGIDAGHRTTPLRCRFEDESWQVTWLPVPSLAFQGEVRLAIRLSSAADPNLLGATTAIWPSALGMFLDVWHRGRQLGARASGMQAALDDLKVGVVLFDAQSDVIFSNAAAKTIISMGKTLRHSGRGLTAVNLRDGIALDMALTHAIAANVGSRDPGSQRTAATLALGGLNSPVIASVVPVEVPAVVGTDAAAILYLVERGSDPLDQLKAICEIFGLSRAEASLASRLASGQALQEAASSAGTTEQAARSALKKIFLKTGTRRQVELIQLLLGSLVRTRAGISPVVLS